VFSDFGRHTLVGDGRYDVSTIGVGPLSIVPETMIFDNEDGCSHYVRYHSRSADLNVEHEQVCADFANGEIELEYNDYEDE